MTLGEMVVHSMSHWPKTMLDSLPGDLGKLTPSVPNYCRVIALPESWTDFAFLTACADLAPSHSFRFTGGADFDSRGEQL